MISRMKVLQRLFVFKMILLGATSISMNTFKHITYSNDNVDSSSRKQGASIVLTVRSCRECASICSVLSCSMFRYKRRQCGLHNYTAMQDGDEWQYYRDRNAIDIPTTPSYTTTERPEQYEKICDHAATYFEDFCYSFVGAKKNYLRAAAKCRKEKLGHLIEVKHQQTQTFMQSFLQTKTSTCVWTGAKRVLRKWKWSHSGTRLSYNSWCPHEPDGNMFSAKNCIVASPTGGFNWNDVSCLAKCHSMCQTKWTGRLQKIYDLPDCGEHEGKGHGQSCYVYRSDKLTWKEAKKSCSQMNMSLVEISDEDENGFVQYYGMSLNLTRYTSIWTGLNDIDEEGNWIWSNGTQANFFNWAPNNPSSFQRILVKRLEEDCVEINVYGNYKWNDVNCGEACTYVCESRWIR